jgi:hypothetical protein
MNPYATLLTLTEREHELVVAGAWEELAGLDAERRVVLAALPAGPPARAARETLERAAEVQAATTALLATHVGELRRTLGNMARGRTAVQGYGGGAGAGAGRPARLDLAG